tara:strand:- start:11829 stop:12452 length:624 start_codon:yes stop_codon:yes gene_type:complete
MPAKDGLMITMNTSMTTKLKQIADIRAGYTYRETPKPMPDSGILMLQIRDVRDSQIIDIDSLQEIKWEGKESQVLKQGEVVIAARGIHNTAALLQLSKTDKKVVPSNQLLILTPKKNILPEYLCWILNYAKTQQQLDEMRTGTNIPSINKRHLEELSVSLPTLEVQQKIIRLYQLRQKEKALVAALETNREVLINGMYQKLLKESHK